MALVAGIACALLLGTYYVLEQTGATTDLARRFLRGMLAAQFRLESAKVDLFGGSILLEDLAVADPTRADTNLVAVDSIRLGVDTDPLGNVLALHELAIEGLAVDIDLTAGHAPNLSTLLREQRAANGVGVGVGEVTPTSLEGGRVRVRVDDGIPALEFADVSLLLQRLVADDGSTNPRRGALRGGARCENLGVDVEIRGDIDLDARACRLQARIGSLRVDAPFVRRLLPLLRTELRDDVASGQLEELVLQLEIPLHDDGQIRASSSFAFTDATCTLPTVPVPLRSASIRGAVSTDDGGTAKFTGQRLLPSGQTEVMAKITGFFERPRLEVRGTGRDVQIDDTVRRALQTFTAGERVVDGLRPSAGMADFDLYLRAEPDQERPVVDLDVQLHGVALSYHGFGPEDQRAAFPLPVVDAEGRVHLRDDIVSIEGVRARIAPEAGGGEVTIEGRVDPSYSGPEQTSIDLHAPRLQFTQALRTALGALVRDDGALYDQFQPEGAAEVRLRIRPTPDAASTWQVLVSPLGAKARWQGFPLPLENVTGSILARSEGLQIELDADYRGGTAALRGKLMAPLDQPGALSLGSIDLRILGRGVPLDDDLRQSTSALAPKLMGVWTELDPRGKADTSLHVRRDDQDAELLYDLTLDLADGAALPHSFPLPISRARGQIFVHGRGERIEVQVDGVRGRLQEKTANPAELAVVGTLHTGPDGYREDLTAVVRGLDLDPELGAVLEATGAIGQGAWDVLRPSGEIDLILRQQSADGQTQRSYTALLSKARSDAEMLPMPATDVSGELRVEGGAMRFSDLRARMGGATVICSDGYVGEAEGGGRTEAAFTVSSQGFPLDDSFARLFVGPMRQSVLDRQMRGTLDINGLRLRFLLPQDGSDQPLETVMQGSVRALDVELLLGARLQQMNGNIRIDESHITRDGGSIQGALTRASLRLFGHGLDDGAAEFRIEPQSVALRALDLSFHGGKVRGRTTDQDSLTYRFAAAPETEGTLSADLEFSGLAVRDFLQQCGLTNTPYHGTASGKVALERLYGYDFVDAQGSGELEVRDGNLGAVPLFTAIYALMAEKNRPRFESLKASFDVRDRKVQMQELALSSPLVTVRGGGSMTMGGYVDVVLSTDSFLGGGADMLLLPPMIQLITNNLVRFHLFGHLRDLQAEQRWVGQRDPRQTALQPVPPRLEAPRRPDF